MQNFSKQGSVGEDSFHLMRMHKGDRTLLSSKGMDRNKIRTTSTTIQGYMCLESDLIYGDPLVLQQGKQLVVKLVKLRRVGNSCPKDISLLLGKSSQMRETKVEGVGWEQLKER